jgi:3-dehydroquinate synthetase
MVAAALISAEIGWADQSLADRIRQALETWGLPTGCPPFAIDDIWEKMAHDKKRRGRRLRWVLPRVIGDVDFTDEVPASIVASVLQDLGARSEK